MFEPDTKVLVAPHFCLHRVLVSFSAAYYLCAFITDITYSKTAEVQWSNFSAWLLVAALVTGGIGIAASVIGSIVQHHGERPRIFWWQSGGRVVIFAIGVLNSFVHARDGWTSVVPEGLVLSILTLVLIVITEFAGQRAIRL